MIIDSILTEWSYRLPKGYPTCSKDYEVLYQVLLEYAKITPSEAQRIVERAQGLQTKIITEAITEYVKKRKFQEWPEVIKNFKGIEGLENWEGFEGFRKELNEPREIEFGGDK